MEHSKLWWNAYKKYYEPLAVPILLVGSDAALCWANAAARGLGLDSAYPHAVKRHIFLQSDSTFFEQLNNNSTIRIPLDEFFERQADFCLTRIGTEESVLGFAVTVQPRVVAPGVNRLFGAERSISTFTYQMRTPISTIFSAVSCIMRSNDAEYEDPDLREYASVIASNSYRLLRTSMHVTQFYRYKYGEMEISCRRRDLRQFMEQLCRMVSVMIEARGLRFRFHIPPDPIFVRFDAAIVSSAFLELISNAAKFTGENGEIVVGLQAGGESAAVSVTDNGLGIADSVVGLVFDPYFSHDPRTMGICGDGLGLWLCREGVLAQGGSIALESHEGDGTRVVFSLPLAEDTGEPLEVRDVAADYLYDRFSDMYVILSDVCKVPEQ